MIRRFLVAGALVGALGSVASAAEPYAGLIASKADAVVAVKLVLHVTVPGRGEQEVPWSGLGTVVDASGVVLIATPSAVPRNMRAALRSADVKQVPSEIRVLFANDPKEYPAILGTSDSRLGLTFVQMKDLEGREIRPLDATKVVDPQVGDLLYGVSRLPQGFDFAPFCTDTRVTGKIMKPREMWNFQGDFDEAAHPLFDASGAVAGMIVEQEASGGGGTFLLPWKTFATTLERAKKASKEALEEALKQDAEGGADTKEESLPEPSEETPKEEAPKEETPKEEPAPGAPK
jgi:hypothetical protein